MTVAAWADLLAGDTKRPLRPRDRPDPTDWSSARSSPYRVLGPDGVETELFPIAVVAGALGRSPCTVRRWEREGILPAAPFRADSHDLRGRRRMYTADWIDRAIAAAAVAGVLDERRSASSRQRLAALTGAAARATG